MVTDTGERNSQTVEVQFNRKWKSDEVQLKGHHDFSETNQLVTTDVMKAEGKWRHDFTGDRLVLYQPSMEWNRASFHAGAPNDYVLLQ